MPKTVRYASNLNRYLFETLPGREKPLFKNAAELAAAIRSVREKRGENPPANMQAQLSQILALKRPLPEAVRKDIRECLDAVEPKLWNSKVKNLYEEEEYGFQWQVDLHERAVKALRLQKERGDDWESLWLCASDRGSKKQMLIVPRVQAAYEGGGGGLLKKILRIYTGRTAWLDGMQTYDAVSYFQAGSPRLWEQGDEPGLSVEVLVPSMEVALDVWAVIFIHARRLHAEKGGCATSSGVGLFV